MEMMKYDNQVYHKNCFKCLDCKRTLQPSSVAMMSGDLYCKECFKKRFKARGKYDDITTVIPGTQKDKAPAGKTKPEVMKKEGKKAEEAPAEPAEAKAETA
eukprot:CAMPEP_0170186168 /NCGR_PEP_ID=MMETSP0040_2-20121228/38439_1 /TAXON_ID=641309 /ORGANISM="Lotharella oceanica, Strain CCMP622" /LENGTH=100 /DNA_ID=CAMNT_0010432813 /DNA_START=35 /DNA_END=337 /DNA_ORIENTATION=+